MNHRVGQAAVALLGAFFILGCSGADALTPAPDSEAAAPAVDLGDIPAAPFCGDGALDAGEACDDGNVAPGDGCDAACAIEKKTALFMTWNVQAEHLDWGGSAVEPRVAALHGLLSQEPSLPGVIALQEFSPSWHSEANFGLFRQLGYELALDDDGLYTEIAYRPGLYELVEADRLPLASQYEGELVEKKTCVTWAVLRDKASGALFIPLSTHWEPNNGVRSDMAVADVLTVVKRLEDLRVEGARASAALVRRLEARYPGAHVVYAGDFNTVDVEIVQGLIGGIAIDALFAFWGVEVGAGVASAHAVLGEESGLIDARSEALALELDIEDVSTTGADDLPSILAEANLPLVIDYAFYSANLELTGYEVMHAEAYRSVSDHFPVKISVAYDLF